MTPTAHAVSAYVIVVALLWGYALVLWLTSRALRHKR